MKPIHRLLCTPEQYEFFTISDKFEDFITSNYKLFKNHVHDIIGIKNSIFKSMEEFQNESEKLMHLIDTKYVNQCGKLTQDFRRDEFVDKYYLWDIPKDSEQDK